MLKIFSKYASVGVVNTLIHWIFFAIMSRAGLSQSLSNFSAFCIAVTFSFLANARWTFNSQATRGRYILYVLFMGVLAAAVGWYADDMKINPIITLVTFSVISLVCGFVYSKFVIFREKK